MKTPKMVYANTPRPWYKDGRKIWDRMVSLFIGGLILVAVNMLGFAFYMMVMEAIHSK